MLKTLIDNLKRVGQGFGKDFARLISSRRKTTNEWKVVHTEIESDDYFVGVDLSSGVDFSGDPHLGNESIPLRKNLKQLVKQYRRNRILFWKKKKSQRKRGWK